MHGVPRLQRLQGMQPCRMAIVVMMQRAEDVLSWKHFDVWDDDDDTSFLRQIESFAMAILFFYAKSRVVLLILTMIHIVLTGRFPAYVRAAKADVLETRARLPISLGLPLKTFLRLQPGPRLSTTPLITFPP